MNNLKSYTEYAVSTPTTDFVIGFDFNYGTDAVNVTVDDVPATEAGYSVIYLNSTTMRLSPAVPTGVVRLQRETDIDVPDNQFTAGAKFIASNMDENFTQLRHAQQEVRDGFGKLSEDTYEIIDTLQVVGQAAQDAADAAEQAAQTANDAAAQVNDKVSYSDLDATVELAVAPVREYTAMPFEVAKSYELYDRVTLDNGDIVKSTVSNNTTNPNTDMTGWYNFEGEQDVINDATIQKVSSIANLIAKSPRGDGQVINVESYFTPNYALADPYMGGDKFIWQANVSKSLHDGGYVIDPLIPIPSLATFNTYHTAQNSTNGVWVRLSDSNDILAENYGLSQSASAVWNCSSIQKALLRAASTNPHKRVMLPAGAYRTTNPIVLSKYTGSAQSGNTYRVPALIGKGRFATELAKVTKNTVGAGYQCGDIDAIVVCSPKIGEDQIFGEETGGFGLMRYAAEALDSGYGYFSMNAPYGNRYDMRMNRAGVCGYWQDNCWMSTVKQINAISCKNGVAIRGGTSVNGTNIYADTCSQIGIDLYGLTYSNLTVHADRCGGDTASANGYPAIRANLTKGVTVTASIEHHRGADFEVKQSDGLVVNAGRTIGVGSVPITAATSKVILEDCAVVFNGFSWRYALTGLTASESGLYSFLTKTGNSVTYKFTGCQGNVAWNDFPLQVSDSQYYGEKTYSGYSENNRIVTSRVGHNSGSFKRWFYAGDASARVRVLSAMAEGSDQYYDFASLIVVGGISTNSGAPTTLTATRYASGTVATGIDIQAYRNTTDGWVYIKPSAGGANLVFNYVLIK